MHNMIHTYIPTVPFSSNSHYCSWERSPIKLAGIHFHSSLKFFPRFSCLKSSHRLDSRLTDPQLFFETPALSSKAEVLPSEVGETPAKPGRDWGGRGHPRVTNLSRIRIRTQKNLSNYWWSFKAAFPIFPFFCRLPKIGLCYFFKGAFSIH